MVKKIILLFFIVVFTFSFFACGKSQSPSDVIKTAYKYANDGKYSDVEKYFSKQALDAIKSISVLTGGIKGICDSNTRNGTIDKIEIEKETIRGEGATVSMKIIFKDKITKNYEAELIKEDGKWKMLIK